MTNNNIGERVRKFRDLLGLSQEEFGDAIGMSHGQVSKVELSRSQPSDRFLNAMMLRFGTNPDWILTGEGEMYIAPKDYIDKGIGLFGAEKMSEGFLTALKDPHFAEFQAFLSMDRINQELDVELQDLLQRAAKLWQQGDERTKQMLVHFVTGFPGVGKEIKKDLK